MYEKVLNNPDNYDFKIQQIGELTHTNPSSLEVFVDDDVRIVFSSQIKNLKNQFQNYEVVPSFEKAGARQTIFHDPAKTKAQCITLIYSKSLNESISYRNHVESSSCYAIAVIAWIYK